MGGKRVRVRGDVSMEAEVTTLRKTPLMALKIEEGSINRGIAGVL